MVQGINNSNRQFFILCLLGIGLLSAPFLSSPDLSSGIKMLRVPPFQKSFLHYLLLMLFLYINYYVSISTFYLKKKFVWFTVITILSYLIILKLPDYIIETRSSDIFMWTQPPNVSDLKTPPVLFSKDTYFFQFIITFLVSLFLRTEHHLNKVKNEKLQSETQYLKAQINPHFLFNTLNSLYALALTKCDEAPNAILKLSKLMRYAVSESCQTYTSLQKEIDYIKDFIDLQKLRITKNVKITTSFKGEFLKAKISPLLLINFIENAFKYGVNGEDDSSIVINIGLDNKKMLFLDVCNTIVETTESHIKSTQKGLKTAKDQLEILYPNRYNLVLSTSDNKYSVKLNIQLE